MKKKLLTFLTIAMVLACVINVQALAMDDKENDTDINNSVGMRYTYIYSSSASISISNGIATTNSKITAASGVDKVVISSYLQKNDGGWKTVKNWRKTVYSNTASLSNSISVSEGSYRVITYFYAYDGSSSESTSRTAYKTY